MSSSSNLIPSHPIFGDRSIGDWTAQYEASHSDPVNRAFHLAGIPMIALSIPLFLIAPLARGFWRIPVGLFFTGWLFQFVGHAFEGEPPEFFKDWRFLVVGLAWWLKTVSRGG
jgi:uncharacterized membrane protein YGL010W